MVEQRAAGAGQSGQPAAGQCEAGFITRKLMRGEIRSLRARHNPPCESARPRPCFGRSGRAPRPSSSLSPSDRSLQGAPSRPSVPHAQDWRGSARRSPHSGRPCAPSIPGCMVRVKTETEVTQGHFLILHGYLLHLPDAPGPQGLNKTPTPGEVSAAFARECASKFCKGDFASRWAYNGSTY